jgi:hypothetical protein
MNHHMPHPAAVERAMSAAQQLLASLGADAEDAELLTNTLDGETDALELCRKIIRVALDAESMAEAAKARVDDLITRADRFAARAHSARETVKSMLEALNLPKLTDPEFTVSLRTGPSRPLVTDPELLEEEFVRIKKSPDLTAIGRAQEAGRQVRGATRSNGSLILTVRTR